MAGREFETLKNVKTAEKSCRKQKRVVGTGAHRSVRGGFTTEAMRHGEKQRHWIPHRVRNDGPGGPGGIFKTANEFN